MGYNPDRENIQIEDKLACIGPTPAGCKGHVSEQLQSGAQYLQRNDWCHHGCQPETNLVRVSFNVPGDLEIGTDVNYFTINGNSASR
jgi:hypothetical protein